VGGRPTRSREKLLVHLLGHGYGAMPGTRRVLGECAAAHHSAAPCLPDVFFETDGVGEHSATLGISAREEPERAGRPPVDRAKSGAASGGGDSSVRPRTGASGA
jgi:hypothetical protein